MLVSVALKAWLLHAGEDKIIGSSRWLIIRTEAEAFVASGRIFRTVYIGRISRGFQTVPLSCSTTVGFCLSLDVTETVLKTGPLKWELSNWTGTLPVSPGMTLRLQSPAVVQPQDG